MKKAAELVMLLKARMHSAGRTSIVRLPRRRLIAGCVALLGGLLLAGSLAQAAPVEGDDILVADGGANKLIRVDGQTGVRSIISDFSNPAQGPVNPGRALVGVAIGRRQIFVTDSFAGIFLVDPRTSHRILVSDLSLDGFGIVDSGLAVDAFGRALVNVSAALEGFFQYYLYRFDPRTETRVTVATLTNVDINDLTLEPPRGGAMHPEEAIKGAILIETDNSAIYRVNPVTGDRSLLSDFSNPAQGNVASLRTGLAVEHSGTILANSGGNSNLLLRINPISGNRTVLSDFDNPAQGPLGANLVGAAVQHWGQVVVAAQDPTTASQNLFRVNPQTGGRVLFSDSANRGQGPSFNSITYIAVVPHNAGFWAPPPAGSFTSPFGPTR